MPVIYLRFTLLQSFSCLPLGFWSEQLLFFIAEKNPIYLTLHRKEFTWFHYKWIYILSVALVLISRPTDVIRFAALWCPDFPTPNKFGINKLFFLWATKIGICFLKIEDLSIWKFGDLRFAKHLLLFCFLALYSNFYIFEAWIIMKLLFLF